MFQNIFKTYYLFLLILIFTCFGCSNLRNFELGFTPTGIPITLAVNGAGEPSIIVGKSICTPIGTFSLAYNAYTSASNSHRTYIELLSKNEDKKYTFELLENGETISWESKKCKTTVENQKYCTIVKVESEEISNLIHKRKEAGSKPSFPEQSFGYFWLTKKLNHSVNWEIKSVGDFFANIFFGIVWVFCVIFDIVIILFSFVIRIFWWVIKLIGYLFS